MTPSTSLEDLITENRQTYNAELMGARRAPRDEAATSDLKGDPDRLAKLAELAGVPPDKIADVAVRGTNVTFQVQDNDGALSAGFFPMAAFADDEDKAAEAADAGEVHTRVPLDPSPQGGTATVASIATEPGEPTDEGLPVNIDNLSGEKVAGLLKDTPEGVDADAVLRHEFAREGGPRASVRRAARTLDMLNEDGNPKGTGD
jgi:hypothetical protein